MKNKKFFNLDQAIRYLNDSVITFKGKPIYIFSIDSGRHNKNFQLFYYDVGDESQKHKTILSDNDDIDMTPVSLGLMSNKSNMNANTGMIMRMPIRLWKVGLTRQNVRIENAIPLVNAKHRGRHADLMLSKELRDTVLGDYPSYKECFKKTQEAGNILAFSRRFAVCGDKLYHKAIGVPVGAATSRGPELEENAFWLKEALEEDFKNANHN